MRNAAREIETRSFDIAAMLARGEELPKMWGVGEDLAGKIREIARTGRCRFLEELRGRFPSGITQLLTPPGLGPKRVRVLYQKLGVGSLADLPARRPAIAPERREATPPPAPRRADQASRS